DYKVSKLADGNCWMVSNLALDGGRTLHTSDSNVTQDRTLPANISNGTASEYDVAQIYSGNANSITSTCDLSHPYCIVNNTNKYGNLYNWNAATATVGKKATTTDVTESICPKGWQLPNNTGTRSFNNLMSAYSLPTTNVTNGAAVQKIQQTPLNFPLAGLYNNSSLYQGRLSSYWSRSVNAGNFSTAHCLTIDSESGDFYPQNDHYKRNTFSVRCVYSS
ncbi:hypothetical protein IKG16_01235, partial [Candidatus Saccharibacteria bacterium]|nr:hypothetical protein [Candidatus Saccharibacteria bacterium]